MTCDENEAAKETEEEKHTFQHTDDDHDDYGNIGLDVFNFLILRVHLNGYESMSFEIRMLGRLAEIGELVQVVPALYHDPFFCI